jgi:hypothetical protein
MDIRAYGFHHPMSSANTRTRMSVVEEETKRGFAVQCDVATTCEHIRVSVNICSRQHFLGENVRTYKPMCYVTFRFHQDFRKN